jgi:hypothetical protein
MTTVGLDIDEGGKPAAIAVARTERREDGTHYIVSVLERLSGRPYDEAAERVAGIVDEAKRRDRSKYQPRLYGNVTATGRPALVALRGHGVQARMIPAYLTPGDGRPKEEDGELRLGQGWLVCRLQELVQAEQLDVLDAALAKELEQELMDWRPSDDSLGSLTTAVGLAVWRIPMEVRARVVGGRTGGLRMRREMGEFLDRAS